MNKVKDKSVCPVEKAGGFDNPFRRLVQSPKKILKPYISKGISVLDVGCGLGYFTLEIAKMLNGSGKVIAADLQQGMLERVKQKIHGFELEQRIELHKCQDNMIGLTQKVDFILAFYMVHEVPDQYKLFFELKSILKPYGKIFIIEPMFHVPKKTFNEMVIRIENCGFEIIDRPKVFFSRTVLIKSK